MRAFPFMARCGRSCMQLMEKSESTALKKKKKGGSRQSYRDDFTVLCTRSSRRSRKKRTAILREPFTVLFLSLRFNHNYSTMMSLGE